MSSVVLATCSRLPDGDDDARLLTDALAVHGVTARWAVWDDPDESWHDTLVVLRSTWDYTSRVTEFVAWAERVPRLANGADVVRWSSEKTYLRDLAAAGLPIVPTAFIAPGETFTMGDLALDSAEFVVKPAVGAGSRGAGRFRRAEVDQAGAHADGLLAAGLTVLVQPYLDAVDADGETALIFVEGAFSHAIRKSAMLPTDTTHAVDGGALYQPESIAARTPSAAEIEVGAAAVAEVRQRFGGDQLYARVDLLPTPRGPVVLELELVEPSLFLEFAPPAAAGRFASAVAARA